MAHAKAPGKGQKAENTTVREVKGKRPYPAKGSSSMVAFGAATPLSTIRLWHGDQIGCYHDPSTKGYVPYSR